MTRSLSHGRESAPRLCRRLVCAPTCVIRYLARNAAVAVGDSAAGGGELRAASVGRCVGLALCALLHFGAVV